MAQIDIDKFVATLIEHQADGSHNYINLPDMCYALKEQGLKYEDGEIVDAEADSELADVVLAPFEQAIRILVRKLYHSDYAALDDDKIIAEESKAIFAAARKQIADGINAEEMLNGYNLSEGFTKSDEQSAAYYRGVLDTIKAIKGEQAMYIVQKKDLYGNWVDVFTAQKEKSAYLTSREWSAK